MTGQYRKARLLVSRIMVQPPLLFKISWDRMSIHLVKLFGVIQDVMYVIIQYAPLYHTFNLLVPLDDFLLLYQFDFIKHALCFHSGSSALVESAALALLPVFAIDLAVSAIS